VQNVSEVQLLGHFVQNVNDDPVRFSADRRLIRFDVLPRRILKFTTKLAKNSFKLFLNYVVSGNVEIASAESVTDVRE
jgi:hypothetical protein